jgi:hypothetical protein
VAESQVTHTLVRQTAVTPAYINQNFRDVQEFVNGQTVHTDGAGLALALTAGLAWESWTPTLTAVTTDPTLGTGSVQEGRFLRMGPTVFARGYIKFGTSGTAAGSGLYRISLPVDCATDTLPVGDGMIRDVTLASGMRGFCLIPPAGVTDRTEIYMTASPFTFMSNTAISGFPAANDWFRFSLCYEAA